jgi:hypothetical protein
VVEWERVVFVLVLLLLIVEKVVLFQRFPSSGHELTFFRPGSEARSTERSILPSIALNGCRGTVSAP